MYSDHSFVIMMIYCGHRHKLHLNVCIIIINYYYYYYYYFNLGRYIPNVVLGKTSVTATVDPTVPSVTDTKSDAIRCRIKVVWNPDLDSVLLSRPLYQEAQGIPYSPLTIGCACALNTLLVIFRTQKYILHNKMQVKRTCKQVMKVKSTTTYSFQKATLATFINKTGDVWGGGLSYARAPHSYSATYKRQLNYL